MSEQDVKTISTWAETILGITPDLVSLDESATSTLRGIEITRAEVDKQGLPFGTEPSTFTRVLHELAPEEDGSSS